MPDGLLPVPPTDADRNGREALWGTLRSVLQAQRASPVLQHIARDSPPEASFGQQRLWFLERLMPGSAIHNQTIAYRLVGPLLLPALERALGEIVRRHDTLRTTLRWSGDVLVQDIHPAAKFVIRFEDLRGSAATHLAARVDAGTEQEACAPFDIDHPPLLRAKLFRLTDDEHRLLITMQHLAFDGWSFDVFMRELCVLYRAFVAKASSPLPELTLKYADWSTWQRRRLQGQPLQRLLDYWQEQMRGVLPALCLPTDHPRRGLRQRRGRWQALDIAPALTQKLKHLAKQEGVTCYMVLLAAFQVLLHRYTGEEDIVVGSPVANRYHAEVERLIGLFVNTLPMRTRINGAESSRELLARVRRIVLAAYEHQDLPFEMLVQTVGAALRSDATPLFQVMFAFQNVPRSNWRLPDLSVEAWNVGNGTAKFDLTLFMWDAPGGFGGLLEYDADLFEPATAMQWLRHFKALLEAIVREPDAPIATLPLLDDAERRDLLHTRNTTTVPYPRDLPIHCVFAQRVSESPEAIALTSRGGTMSYDSLERRANQLARHLQRHGVARGTLVGVCLHRSHSLVVTLLAILKSGGAFVPVDPSWPAERIGVVLACASVVVTQDAIASGLHFLEARIVSVDGASEAVDRERDEPLDVDVAADDLAYVMYTSGSSGVPKGVCVPHRGVVRLVQSANYAELTRADVFLQLASVAFDASTFEIWGALLNGATLAVPSAAQPSLDDIGQTIRRFGVSILWLTSGLFETMVDTCVDDLRAVRQLLVGGDVLSVRHAEHFLRQVPGCRLVNCYGPTENTTFTTFHPVQLASCAPSGSIPIGRPVSNTQVYVLDKHLQPVPLGVAGDAYVGGDGLMRGYLGDSMSTRERLVHNPFDPCPGEWLYRTGDIVRWRRDGALEFVCRDDDQVKIRGFRVEPGEVEAILGRCPAVQSVAVIAADDATQGKRLRAFAVAAADLGRDDTIREMREFLRQRLPDYLVPSEFIVVDAIPLGANGKVDRQRLRAAVEIAPAPVLDFVAPRNAHEQAIVRVFEQILGVSPIGVDNDFFDSGGSSLSVLRLVAMLDEAFAIDLPLASLYEHSTPARLAVLVAQFEADVSRARADREAASALVEIKHGRGAAPLFLVPGGHGGMAEMTLYAKVLSHVRSDQPVYGFVAQGVDGRAPAHASVEEMAEAYVAAMRGYQPHGPYALAGECVGGLIAFEMAQRLVAQREEIALLLLLDTWCPTLAGVLHYRHVERTATLLAARRVVARRGIAEVARVLREHVRDRPPFGPLRSLRYTVNVARTLLRVARPWLAAINGVGKPAAGAERIAAAQANYVQRTMRYRPRRYPGRVTLIVCADNERRGLANPWRALAGEGLVIRSVPGDHDSYLRDTPQFAATAVEECLNQALRTSACAAAIAMPTEYA